MKSLSILGIRGLPASHGGFETFAEKLALYLQCKGWKVSVYCQVEGVGSIYETVWNGIRLINVPVNAGGDFATIIFDLRVAWHARREKTLCLTLGYNTAVFNLIQRIFGQINVFNMDGIEWRRGKWGFWAKSWFWINERFGCWLGNHLIADHPEIKKHLATRVADDKITMIPYGGNEILTADVNFISKLGLLEKNYSLVIARPEPENSILEIVVAFSSSKRNHKLVVLGGFSPSKNSYHAKVIAEASDEVLFLGPIYEQDIVSSLRYHSCFYFHGHTVGGTNPSLVEAMGAGCAIIAHDNKFNRWVANDGARYFSNSKQCSTLIDEILNNISMQNSMRDAAKLRYKNIFTWDKVLSEYEILLERWHDGID